MKPESTDDDITQPTPAGQGAGPVYWNPPQKSAQVSRQPRKRRSAFLPVMLTIVLAASATPASLHLYEDVAHPAEVGIEFLPTSPHKSGNSPTSPFRLVAAFPSNSRAVCGSDSNGPDISLSPLTNPRVRIGSSFPNSCGFVANVSSAVNAQIAKNSAVQSFHLAVPTPRNGSTYLVQCTRNKHLSRCVVGGKNDHVIYVQDPLVST